MGEENDFWGEIPANDIKTAIREAAKNNIRIPISDNIKREDLGSYYRAAINHGMIEMERWFVRETVEERVSLITEYHTWFDHWKAEHPKITRWIPKRWRAINITLHTKNATLQFNYPYPGVFPQDWFVEGKRIEFADWTDSLIEIKRV